MTDTAMSFCTCSVLPYTGLHYAAVALLTSTVANAWSLCSHSLINSYAAYCPFKSSMCQAPTARQLQQQVAPAISAPSLAGTIPSNG